MNLEELSPREIVDELDRYIIGQNKAKKAVAIALRNRIRRQNLSADLRDEVAPKNIIMIGPTGVGKTEIARRLSKLTGAPFIKVEATKYTEVGYVGRDVESMIRDLMLVAVNMVKQEMQSTVKEAAARRAEEEVLDLLLPGSGEKKEKSSSFGGLLSLMKDPGTGSSKESAEVPPSPEPSIEEKAVLSSTREKFRERLRSGAFDDKEIEIQISRPNPGPSIEIFSGSGMEDMDMNLSSLGGIFGSKKKKKKVKVPQALEILTQEETEKLIDLDRVSDIARERVESMGIVFVDEIDKIASREGRSGVDVSREGVQRDILPIVEGAKVSTKHGMVDTTHILFIAAGAFHMSKPSDLIPELQGRFPIRVELEALTTEDFYRILTQPENALIKQYMALMKTEGVNLKFNEESLQTLANLAAEVNSKTENIGARRLHTMLELLLEDISFQGPELKGQEIEITSEYVYEKMGAVVQDQDLSRYIL
ncbi:MAG: ATP-dependent protease ATPase subunit HslU [Spirochaetales bacterium]|nr:ATP-dependent protease ATPase subunit HslU [Spirochaetales bacterium]